jgi:hypothetical protein
LAEEASQEGKNAPRHLPTVVFAMIVVVVVAVVDGAGER